MSALKSPAAENRLDSNKRSEGLGFHCLLLNEVFILCCSQSLHHHILHDLQTECYVLCKYGNAHSPVDTQIDCTQNSILYLAVTVVHHQQTISWLVRANVASR